MNEINLIGGFYKSKSLPFSAQDVVNWLPVPSKSEAARSPIKLRGLPGLRAVGGAVINALSIFGNAPNATIGATYTFSYAGAGGEAPYVFSIVAGFLPAGLSMSSAGVITGTPTTQETATFRVRLTDASNQVVELEDSIQVIAISGGYWIGYGENIVGRSIAVVSADGADWSGSGAVLSTGFVQGVVCSGTDRANIVACFLDTTAYRSTDGGFTWNPVTLALTPTQAARRVFSFGSRLHAGTPVSGQNISDDAGLTWSSVTAVNAGQASIFSMAEISGTLYGTRGADKISAGGSNGSSWDETGTVAGFTTAYFMSQGSTIIIGAIGGDLNRIAITTNFGGSWSSSTIPISTTSPIRSQCSVAGGGDWVVVNQAGEIAYSSNGTSWTKSTFAFPSAPRAIDYGDGRFVIVGTSGSIAYSDDAGVSWTTATAPDFGSRTITALAFIP